MNHLDLFDRVIVGLEDEHEIKMLCDVMLAKLCVLDPDETSCRLDSIADKLRIVLSFKPKENSVKQEVEKVAEANRAALKVAARLNTNFPQSPNLSSNAQGQGWKAFWDWVNKEFKSQLSAVEMEARNQA